MYRNVGAGNFWTGPGRTGPDIGARRQPRPSKSPPAPVVKPAVVAREHQEPVALSRKAANFSGLSGLIVAVMSILMVATLAISAIKFAGDAFVERGPREVGIAYAPPKMQSEARRSDQAGSEGAPVAVYQPGRSIGEYVDEISSKIVMAQAQVRALAVQPTALVKLGDATIFFEKANGGAAEFNLMAVVTSRDACAGVLAATPRRMVYGLVGRRAFGHEDVAPERGAKNIYANAIALCNAVRPTSGKPAQIVIGMPAR